MNVGEHRSDHLAPHGRAHVGVFIEHDAVEIGPAQPVRIVGAVDTNARAVDQLDPKLGFALGDGDR
jgi:hypothetical protein